MKTTIFRCALSWFILFMLSTSCSNIPPEDIVKATTTSNSCGMSNGEINMGNDTSLDWEDIESIELGVSTLSDLITKFGAPKTVQPWHSKTNELQICRYIYSNNGPVFWTAENTVVGVEFPGSDYQQKDSYHAIPGTISEAMKLYGSPALVTWSNLGAGSRSVFWDEGILARVNLDQEIDSSLISNIYFIQPMTMAEFADSFWSEFTSQSPPNHDVIDSWPENPFD